MDNDGDGTIDTVYRFIVRTGGDAGCVSPTDVTERFDCEDGIDNDGDGRVDTADPGCTMATDVSELATSAGSQTTQCDDGVDNDNDGLTDYRPNGSGDPGPATPTSVAGREGLGHPYSRCCRPASSHYQPDRRPRREPSGD